ncbi:type IV pilus secretin PilQ [Chitiniphilus purpureus]|uniref:Type IV pilus biogenesis and competence protein PilQ n=1 Tax=Chitiniphilus purpureus TaxID=2981137 RepID=A0ABY6DP26_9NEIS|nr:type IV pilus secretin PilQ [Chitiniphilus sp. CD1]UXY16110.1 type IV pilus secretin PilQ [Chitiniphilus sp. CD1]
MKNVSILKQAWLVCGALAVALCSASQASDITNVEVNTISNEKQVVKVQFDGPVPQPTSFAVSTPPRVAFDFPGTANKAGKSSVQVNSATLRLLNLAEGTGRTRLVLNLNKQAAYETNVEGNAFLVTIDGSTSAVAAKTETTHFAQPTVNTAQESLTEVDFRRGVSGEGKVVIDLSSPNVGIDIRQQGSTLVVDFLKAELPERLQRRMDVADFGTPVQKLDTYRQGSNVRMVIQPIGNWEYSAYQTENRFIIEVRKAQEDSRALSALRPNYKGEKLSLNFQNVEIRTVLQVIAEFTGLNIITSDTVSGSLTLRLKDVPWDQALDIILQAKGLDQRRSGNVLWVAPRDELAAKEKQELEAKKQILELEPTRTEMFQLKYQKADDFKKILTDEKQRILSPRGSVVIDPRTNILIVQDVPSKLDQLRDIIGKTDIPVRQVMIEARIVEARDGFSRDLGARLSWGATGHVGNTNVSTWPTLAGTKLDGRGVPTNTDGSMPFNVNLPVSGSPGTLALIAANADWLLGLEINALEADNQGKIISSPRLVTADQTEAVIEDGTEIPYAESSQNGATSISFKKATLSLRVTPQITPDGNVIMDVKVNKDSRGDNTLAGPAIDTKQISTKVLVENGGTIVIGGIYTQTIGTDIQQVPLLGDVPVLGHLFKNTSKRDEKRELLIFITPKIVSSEVGLR